MLVVLMGFMGPEAARGVAYVLAFLLLAALTGVMVVAFAGMFGLLDE
jgi:hypothetical protein